MSEVLDLTEEFTTRSLTLSVWPDAEFIDTVLRSESEMQNSPQRDADQPGAVVQAEGKRIGAAGQFFQVIEEAHVSVSLGEILHR